MLYMNHTFIYYNYLVGGFNSSEKILVSWEYDSQYVKNMFQTTNQYIIKMNTQNSELCIIMNTQTSENNILQLWIIMENHHC